MDAFLSSIIWIVAIVCLLAASSFGRISVLDDCNAYGQSKIGDVIIECHKQPATAPAGG